MIPYQDTKYHHPVFKPLYQIERGEESGNEGTKQRSKKINCSSFEV